MGPSEDLDVRGIGKRFEAVIITARFVQLGCTKCHAVRNELPVSPSFYEVGISFCEVWTIA